jgi:hypothetical protein
MARSNFREVSLAIARNLGFTATPAAVEDQTYVFAFDGVDGLSVGWDVRESCVMIEYFFDVDPEYYWRQKEYVYALDRLVTAVDGLDSHKNLMTSYRKHMDLTQATVWLSANAEELTEIFIRARTQRLELKKNWKPRRRFLFW